MTATARAQVTMRRTDPTDVGQRQIYARLDDGPTRVLLFGESHTENIAPGSHSLRANNTLFWKNLTFTATPGEQIEFMLINRAGAFTTAFLGIFGVAPLSLVIEKRAPRAADSVLSER